MVLVEPPGQSLQLLRDALPSSLGRFKTAPAGAATETEAPVQNGGATASSTGGEYDEVFAYVASLASSLSDAHDFDPSIWTETLAEYLTILPELSSRKTAEDVVETYRDLSLRAAESADDSASSSDEEDGETAGEQICNIQFSLAYGGKILLHRTHLRLRRGRRYGLVGQNGSGKTTLMNAINNGRLDGWPSHLRTAYVDSGSNVDPVFQAKNVLGHLMESCAENPDGDGQGKTKADAEALLKELKFTETMMNGTIGELSGGWQMKLRLARAVLMDPDIMLLDEPTNHLDHGTVRWLTDYLLQQTKATVITVSHDTNFMEEICTDVVHYEKRDTWVHRKLVHYKGTMSAFVRKQPRAKHYFELSTDDGGLKFKFPDPGRLEGIRTSTQKFLDMEGVDFCYPGSDRNILSNVTLKLNLSSRVAILGANGAGKTTLVKMIVGDTTPSNLESCNFFIHHNLRVAYVAQHSFYHVEEHIESSPAAYIQWRFKDAYDKEKLDSEAFRISKEEQEKIEKFGLEAIWSRRVRAGILEYEVKKKNVPERDNKYYSKEKMLEMGFERLLKQTDEKIAAVEAGLDLRPVTTTEIQRHLDDFGLAQEFGTYGKIRGLSGGQKVKLVLAAAMWNSPHLLVLDEPTNYLDREALAALSSALNEWGGAVLMISHNKEFYSSVCREEWLVKDGSVFVHGESTEREMKAVAKKKTFAKEEKEDTIKEKAGGNLNADGDKFKDATQNFWGKAVSKKEARNYDKAKKKGDVETMRKILQIPPGKIMPGYEELGDGNSK